MWLIFEFECISERTVVCTLQIERREEIQRHSHAMGLDLDAIIIIPPSFFLLPSSFFLHLRMTSEQGAVAYKCYRRSGEFSLLGEYQVFVHEKCYLRELELEYSEQVVWSF